MGWGTSFEVTQAPLDPTQIGCDLATEPSKMTYAEGRVADGVFVVTKELTEKEYTDKYKPDVNKAISEHQELIRKHNNKVPTHDPYTNPKSHIYYSCECGQILDPGTHRFAELNNAASKAGWKIRWGDHGYVPHCVECARGIE